MRSMKRVQLVVLFLVAVALLPCTLAVAGNQWVANLTCLVAADPPDPDPDPDCGASGIAKLNNLKTLSPGGTNPPWLMGNLSVNCSGLTPGARYTVSYLGTFPANSSGQLSVRGKIEFGLGYGLEVWVVREDGVAVLVGTMP
jgi:hypothetical protein